MKLLVAVISLLICVHTLQAGSAMTVRNATGSTIGRIAADGTVYATSGSIVGRIKPDGKIFDASDKSIGAFNANGTIYNKSGSIIGRIGTDGSLQNSSGAGIGKIEGATVRNKAGSIKASFIGASASDRPVMAAYLFLFEKLLD